MILLASHIMAYASYDGRLADNPYHKSPTWLYVIIIIAVVCAILKGLTSKNNKGADVTRKRSETKSNPVTKVYQETGRFWDECPYCKGSGWIDGKEISYLVAPPKTVCCDQCKGYGHQLTPEAERLHAEYCKQCNEEQTERRKLFNQREKERAEKQKKLSNERWNRKQKAIADIRSAGRSVLKEDEYLKQLEDLRVKRKELGKEIMDMLKGEPLCPSCQDGNKKRLSHLPRHGSYTYFGSQ